ncbi:MAG: 3-oxoacyl-ACP reductase FabG [Proteobacteria bacterium]|nr:3-oxoacyl-ACP reductase FabG [Pseudomonadota bacterium]MBI3496131.1 3-oxoacyl-ACP reductase FabG [Pseudomonadota bacterium]
MTLKDKSAIITGSSRGIGRAVALRFASDGARVVVNCVANRTKADAVAQEIRNLGGEAIVIRADVSRRRDAERLIKGTVDAFGKLDILVSNAGIIIDRPFMESTDEDWERAIGTNLTGFFNVTRAALPHMIERRTGRIIATGSCITEIADFGGNKYSVCTASKGGITMMLRPIAAEAAPFGVTVNAVSPGYIATEMLGAIDQAGLAAALKLVPMQRYGKPEEIAAAMAFLASDEAAYITGQTLRVNGGLSMG